MGGMMRPSGTDRSTEGAGEAGARSASVKTGRSKAGATRRSDRPLSDQPAIPLRAHAYDSVKQRIIDLTYRPGASLNEAQISADLGIGRTPVHMAIMRLAQEGLIEIVPRRGLIVAPLTIRDIQSLFEARLVNEPAAARLAASRASEEERASLTAGIAEGQALGRNGAREALMAIDQNFHAAVAQATRNSILEQLLRGLHDRARRFYYISWNFDSGLEVDTMAEHRDVVDAIIRRRPDDAEAAMRNHIESSARVFGGLQDTVGDLLRTSR